MSEVTQILCQIESGDPAAAEQLLPLVYNELRKLTRGWARSGKARTNPSGNGASARRLYPAR